jgi:hypothetical protein
MRLLFAQNLRGGRFTVLAAALSLDVTMVFMREVIRINTDTGEYVERAVK